MACDCHIHMALDGFDFRKAFDRHRVRPDDDFIHRTLKAYADSGCTFLRDGGDKFGAGERARTLAPQYGIDYRTPIFPISKQGRYGGFIGRSFEDFSQYKALVREVIDRKGDFIKIMISGLMDFDHYGVITSEPLTRDEIRDMIAYAHDCGLAVMAHANGSETVLNAVEGGIDTVEHGAYLNDECLCAMTESDAVWVPTISTIGNLTSDDRFPQAVTTMIFDYQQDAIRKYAKHGGKLAVGSDAGAYRVFHASGWQDESAYLHDILGADADALLSKGEAIIRERFQKC